MLPVAAMRIILSVFLLATSINAADLTKDLKDSAEAHRLLGEFRKTQAKLNEVTKRFAVRNRCPTGDAVLDGAGFLMCAAAPPIQPPPAPKPEPHK